MPTIDEVLGTVATTVHSQMQVTRVLVVMQDPLAGSYKVEAQSGLIAEELERFTELPERAPVIEYLQRTQDVLVRDELTRRVSAYEATELSAELDQLKTPVCVPMILDDRLVGMMCVGEKVNRQMF